MNYPSAPAAGRGLDPEAPYGRHPVTGKPLSDKKAAIAGVLQLFFGMFGAGRFYIGSKTIGRCQLGVTIFAFAILVVGPVFFPHPPFNGTLLIWLGVLLPLAGVAIWAFIDAILMFTRTVTDGQGRKLR